MNKVIINAKVVKYLKPCQLLLTPPLGARRWVSAGAVHDGGFHGVPWSRPRAKEAAR